MNTLRDNKIVDLYKSGLSMKKVADIIGLSESRVKAILKNNNVTSRLRKEYIINKKHKCNERFFEVIDTEIKAYFFGLIYADGCVYEKQHKVSISLHEDDKHILERFVKEIEGTQKFVKHQNSLSIGIYSRFMMNDLISKGCIPKKSLVKTFPSEEIVPKNLQNHFIRGYFDGNGCITQNKNSKDHRLFIVSTYEFLDGLRKAIDLPINKILLKSKEGKNTYTLTYGGNLKVEKILNIIYKNATVFLDRKYQKYIKLKEFNQNRRL